MTRSLPILFLGLFSAGCAGDDEGIEPIHATCDALDERNVRNRLDNLVSSHPEDFALEGHCLEATFNQPSGSVWSAQFAPASAENEGPPFHIQVYFAPPEQDMVMEVYRPDDLVKAKCQDVPEGKVCAHVDDNTNDAGVDEVDLRVLTGTLDMQIVNTAVHTTTYEGELVWTIWGIDTTPEPDIPTEPAIKLEGTLHLSVDR
jgi:hypothetical protein